jgi:hypothetical protein
MHQLEPTRVSTCFNCWVYLRTMNLHSHKMVIMFISSNGVSMTSCNFHNGDLLAQSFWLLGVNED